MGSERQILFYGGIILVIKPKSILDYNESCQVPLDIHYRLLEIYSFILLPCAKFKRYSIDKEKFCLQFCAN